MAPLFLSYAAFMGGEGFNADTRSRKLATTGTVLPGWAGTALASSRRTNNSSSSAGMSMSSSSPPAPVLPAKVVAATAVEATTGRIKLYSPAFYQACTIGGILSCGLTHTAVTPLDVVKCNMQIDPLKYRSIGSGFATVVREQGFRGLFKGWAPTLFGYSAQGACKYGFYEYFKKTYADLAGPEFYKKYQTLIYLSASASAEFIADVALCPFEAVKVKVQTNPGFAKGIADGMPKFVQLEGVGGLYKGVAPLWGRQIPYTMVKFAAFENIVQMLYKYVVPKEKCTKTQQLGVSFAAGYIAGILCAVVSHPADNLVSKLNAKKGAKAGDIIREMGWLALFTRGLPLRIIMIGTLTGLQWGIYDSYKVYVGLPTAGGAPSAGDKKS